MKLKKIAKFTGRCAFNLVSTVFAKAFEFGFVHGSYAYYYWRWPDGSHEMADEFRKDNEQRFVDAVDEWFDKHSTKKEEEEWVKSDLWYWEEKLNELHYKMIVNGATQAEFEILRKIKKHAVNEGRLEYCRDIVFYHDLFNKYVKEESV